MSKITTQKQIDIVQKVNNIFEAVGAISPDCSLVDIAKVLSADVFESNFSEENVRISGAVKYDNSKMRYGIYLNKGLPQTRKNFTLAHELGHIALHSSGLKSNAMKFRIDDFNYPLDQREEETEANFFAAELLMPYDRFIRAYRLLSDKTLRTLELAELFNVSESAVNNRVAWIKQNSEVYGR